MNAPVAPGSTQASRIQRVVSPGGVEAWLVEDYTVPLVALEFSMRGGAAQDPADRAGTCSFLSAVLDEGAGPFTAAAFHERLEEHAIELRFSCDRDRLSGRLRTLVKHRAEAFEMLRLALQEPRFDDEALDRVRAQIEAGIRHEANDPDAMAGRSFFETAFPGHPYGRPTQGSLDTLARIERRDIETSYAQIVSRQTVKIGVVGAIDATSLGRDLDRVFAPLPAQARLSAIPDVVPSDVGRRRVIELAVPQSSVRFGAQGFARHDPDWIPALVVNHVLGGGVFSSRLFREVREKRGLAYSVSSQLVPFEHAALHFGGTSTRNERVAESIAIIEEQIASLAALGPTAEELDKARNYITGSYALNFDTSTKIAGQLVRIQVDDLGIDYMVRRNGLVHAVTMEDAARTARRLYGDGELLIAVVGQPVGL